MDFISLANDQRHLLRRLDQMLGDDDTYDAASTTIASDGGFVPPPPTAAGKPFLSPQAGAELHLLATNFLLYTAMVIIVVVICKAYFPEWLESRDVVRQPRKFDYRVAEEQDYFDDDDDEDEDEDDEEDSSESNGDDDYFRFQPETMSRQQVMQRLILCTILLNITFVTWGALQERMLTRRYPRYTGDYFTYSYALVFTNRFWTLLFSTVLWVWFRPRRSQTAVIYEYSFPSISNMLSSWCQYEALRYVSFPATTLFKSFKLAPVMLMGKVLGNKSYPQYEYGVALAIGIGICMFMTSTDDLNFETALRSDFQHDYLNREVGTAWTGVMLLCFFLLFDSFTSQFQSRMFQRHQDLSIIELMLATSAFSTALSLITLVHTKELYPAWNFMMEHSEIHLHFLLFSLCSTIGQLFIFYTIKNFGAVVFAFMMTLRVLLSIALSCVMYGHKVSATGFFGLILVLGAALYRVRKKAEGQQLIKWQGMEDTTKAFDLLHEWHEHVDM